MRSIRFTVPRLAADAVDFVELRRRADATKLPDSTIECTVPVRLGEARITASFPMAILFTETLTALARAAAEQGKSNLAIACAEGALAAFTAIDEERARRVSSSST